MTTKKETTLLDSSLNTVPFSSKHTLNSYKKYSIKILDCKEYKQLYIFEKSKFYKYKDLEDNLHLLDYDKKLILNDNNYSSSLNTDNEVLFKNVIRSKIKLQRLAKSNCDSWKTFITLTFNENITDLSIAYKKFRNFTRSISRIKKDFKWLCVPEFQKSGRVHYHLVTNIDLEDQNIIFKQEFEGNIYFHTKQWQKNGFDCIESVKDKDGNDTKKICGYISKYMSKSYIEDCFFNRNRYYCSQNLNRPREILIDLDNEEDLNNYLKLINTCDAIYSNNYKDNFDNLITFIELREK